MKTQSGIRRAVVAAFLAGSLMCGASWAGPMDEAQPLGLIPGFDPLTGETGKPETTGGTVTATITGGTAVVFSFWANPTDLVTVDIDTDGSVDTIVSVHSPATAYTVEDVMDDSSVFPFDPGSNSPLDPMMQNWVPDSSGIHYAAVTVTPDRVADGGTFLNLGGAGSGTFTLNVKCVRTSSDPAAPPPCAQGSTPPPSDTPLPSDTPPTSETPPEPDTTPPTTEVKYVRIDVRPGSRALVRLNPRWNSLIPVAILGGPEFNVRDIDVSSLTFGRTGDEQSLRNCSKHLTRVNRDRKKDLVCYFRNEAAGFELGDERGVLKGLTTNGMPIEGSAMLKVLPEKRHYGHKHGKGHGKHDGDDRRHRGHSQTSWHR
jgi:hypothetical protein